MPYLIYLGQICLAILVAVLMGGPLRFFMGSWTPDLIVVSIWLFAWLGKPKDSLTWAVILGITLDLVSFRFFGFWTLLLLGLTFVLNYLKGRYLEISSPLEALAMLMATFVVYRGLIILISQSSLILLNEVFGLIATVIVGIILYYALATQGRLFAHWKGRRF